MMRTGSQSAARIERPPAQPSVLVVLVVRDGARWLQECLRSAASQTHSRVGVIAVDNGSTDGSREFLEHALGPARVLSVARDAGVAASVRAAMELPGAQEADYVLVLHDDAALEPDAVARLVEAARMEGTRPVGVVGPKVVDWENPRLLREVGHSTDRFAHPYTRLEEGEVDHGQYDRLVEVLYVSSCAMLISRDAWRRADGLDERLGSHHEDLDFCWRARLAGYRVVMTPLARVRHRAAGERGEREEAARGRTRRYFAERAGLVAMLKNYGVASLAWLLPLYAILGTARVLLLALSRRFEDAYELLGAWAWNLLHLPGTLRRRVRAQAVRTARDRQIRRFMESTALRFPRWIETLGQILAEQRGLDEEERAGLRVHAAALARTHPVLVAWVLALAVGGLAVRGFLGPEPLQGGVLPAFPDRGGDFFRELISAVRTTGLGGNQAGSPALAALGGLSAALLGNTALALKAALALGPPLAGVMLYRALLRRTGQRVPAVVAGACYTMSAVVLWAFSEGRLDLFAALAVLPLVAERLEAAFSRSRPTTRRRLAAGAGVPLAVGTAFFPGLLLPVGVLLAVQLLASPARLQGLAVALGAAAVAAVLLFPMVPDLVGGAPLGSRVGEASVADAARLVLGPGPGSSPAAWFLPVAAILGFSVVGREDRGTAWRALVAGTAGLALAWASAAGRLPDFVANPIAYVTLVAVSEATLVALGIRVLARAGREAFGYHQVAAALLTVAIGGGLIAQAALASSGNWEVNRRGLPAAWPVIASEPGEFRILWLGRLSGAPFPPPGGDPQGVVEAGPASTRYALTDRDGVSALDLGRGSSGPGYRYLEAVLGEVLSGTTSHGGTLLGVLSIGFVVAGEGDLAEEALDRLGSQADLDLVPAGGLVIYRNARTLPPAAVVAEPAYPQGAASAGPGAIATLPPADAGPLDREDGVLSGSGSGTGVVLLAQQFAPDWRLTGDAGTARAREAFGWAMSFPAPAGPFRIEYAGQWVRTVEMTVLAALWLAALWVTRKPVTR